jgi:hypothetical protein
MEKIMNRTLLTSLVLTGILWIFAGIIFTASPPISVAKKADSHGNLQSRRIVKNARPDRPYLAFPARTAKLSNTLSDNCPRYEQCVCQCEQQRVCCLNQQGDDCWGQYYSCHDECITRFNSGGTCTGMIECWIDALQCMP